MLKDILYIFIYLLTSLTQLFLIDNLLFYKISEICYLLFKEQIMYIVYYIFICRIKFYCI